MPRILTTSVLLPSLATICLASPPPATGSDTTERTSPRMVAAYHRESVSSARAGELISRGDNDYAAGRYAEAKRAYREALDTLDPKKDSEARGQVLLSIGGALRLEGRAVAAEQPLQEALAVFTQNDGEQSLRAALVMEELAKAKSKQNLLDQAEETALRAYHVFEHLLGVSDPRSLLALRAATEILAQKRDAISIIQLIEPRVAQLDGQASIASESLRAYFDTMLGSSLINVFRDKDAESYFRKAILHLERSTPVAKIQIADNELQLGEALLQQARLAEAETYILSATRFLSTSGDANRIGSSEYELGKLFAAQGDYSSAIKSYDAALAAYVRGHRPSVDDSLDRVRVMEALAMCKIGQCAQGERLARAAFVGLQKGQQRDRDTADVAGILGVILLSEHKYIEAAQTFNKSVAISERLSLPMSNLMPLRVALGMALYGANKMSEAEQVLRHSIDDATAAGLPKDETFANANEWLGEILYSEGRIEEAEISLLAAGADYEALQSGNAQRIVGAFFCALVGYSKNRPDIAERMLQLLLPYFSDPKHPGALVLGEHLHSLVMKDQGRTGEATQLQRHVIQLCAKTNAAIMQACALVKRTGWVAHCPPCSPARASSIEILRAMDALNLALNVT